MAQAASASIVAARAIEGSMRSGRNDAKGLLKGMEVSVNFEFRILCSWETKHTTALVLDGVLFGRDRKARAADWPAASVRQSRAQISAATVHSGK